jgi:hypothetical protein
MAYPVPVHIGATLATHPDNPIIVVKWYTITVALAVEITCLQFLLSIFTSSSNGI